MVATLFAVSGKENINPYDFHRMDASQYLRRLAERCPKTVSRTACVDASLYTQMKGLAATRTYISPATVPSSESNSVVPPLPCQVGGVVGFNSHTVGYGGGNSGSVEAVKPPAGCPSQGVCEFFTNRYTNPTVQLPGCEYTQFSTAYLATVVECCVQGTTAEQARAVQTRVNRDLYDCCASANNEAPPS